MEAATKATHLPRAALRSAVVPRSVPRSGSRVFGAAKALGSSPFFGGVAQAQGSGGVERTPATFKAPKGTKDEGFYAVWFLCSTEFVVGIEDCDLRVYCCSMSMVALSWSKRYGL